MSILKTLVLLGFFIQSFGASSAFAAEPVERIYNLRIHHKAVNFTGVSVSHGMAINDSIPAPTLRFKMGEMAVIHVKNELREATSLHWHGILLPWNMDGPSFTNNKLILPGETFTFRFPIRHTGTYWYHSHTMLQEQQGLYGAIVIEDDHHRHHVNHDRVVVLSDWINEHPMTVLRNLKMDGHYYSYKNQFFPSVIDAIRRGEFWDYLKSEWIRMGPMDLSDVGYDAFLANGAASIEWPEIRAGQSVRLRVINAGASTYFYLNLGNLRDFRVISKDGVEVKPVDVNEILIGMGETYDIRFNMPSHAMGVEFRATSQDTTGYSRIMLGQGHHNEFVPDKIRPSPYKMDDHEGHDGGHDDDDDDDHGDHGDHSGHSSNVSSKKVYAQSNRLNYAMLESPTATAFDPSLKRREITLEFTGDMERYTWYINGKPFSEERYIPVRYNEVVRFKMVNKTMMHHPMHLHGHFFRVLNGKGDHAPNFHTVDVGPHATVTIEFWANEPGIWFFHCHNLYHMKMGMARLVKYEGFELPHDLKEHAKEHEKHFMTDRSFYAAGEASIFTNHASLKGHLSGGRWDISLELELDKYDKDTFEGNILFKRYVSQYLALLGGGEYEDSELHAILGAAYTLPMNVLVIAYTRSDGKSVVRLSKSIPLYGRLSLDLDPKISFKSGKRQTELESSLMYQMSPKARVGLFYKDGDSVGRTVGFGFRVQF